MIGFIIFCAAVLHTGYSADTNCDTLGLNFYRAIGCEKVEKDNECPSYENCKYEQPTGYCKYQGHKIEKGQLLSDVVKDTSCNFGCVCTTDEKGKGNFICAQGQCGFYPELQDPKSTCYLKYTLNSCCGEGEPICEKPSVTCKVDDQTYNEGERFYPKDKCVTCICTKNFNGKFEGPDCQLSPCDAEVRYAKEIENNCAPLYFKGNEDKALCCPVDFVCPSTADIIKEDDTLTGDKVCRYGLKTLKLGATLESENGNYGRKKKVLCQCVAPPLLTCTMPY